MSVRFGVSYGSVPYGIALHTCDNCGESVLEPDLAKSPLKGWLSEGADIQFCPDCVALHPPAGQPTREETHSHKRPLHREAR